jgi:SWI/SNF-related matrix-associated actin-dependent regulator of chromatin subfamily A member 5
MMGRIQKKLYLSSKVTESMRDIHTPKSSKRKGRLPAANDNDAPQLSTTQLMSLVRRGTQALSHPELDVDEMLGWTWETMLENCKDKPADIHVQEATQKDVIVKEDDEKKWLAQIEHVESRVFAGKKWMKENKDGKNSILEEYVRADRRKGKNTTVMVDGFAISKESMQCGDWEAVPTMAGKDPRLAEPKRERRASIKNQEVRWPCTARNPANIFASSVRCAGTEVIWLYARPVPGLTTQIAWINISNLWQRAKCHSTVRNTNAPIASRRHRTQVV